MLTTCARLVLVACAALALLAGTSLPAPASQPQDEPDTHALALECRGALWKRAFDEATAAGLNPGAIAVEFTASKASRRDEGADAILTGVEDYRPTTDVPPFPVRYECRIDRATSVVRAVTYAAIDANGDDVARAPWDLVKDGRLLAACIDRIEEGLEEDVRRRGVSAPVATVEIAPADAEFVRRGDTVDIQGRGRATYAKGFDWQILVFQCRYDTKRQRVTREIHGLETASPAGALPPERQAAVEECRMAIGEQVLLDAQSRGYRRLARVEIELPELADVTARGGYLDVSGRGEFRLDPRHVQPTPVTFTCAFDPRGGRIVSARFEVARGSWTPSGEIATEPTESLRCGGRGLARQECRASIRGNVRIIREFGRERCEAYRNWMWSNSQIVVWGGCAAEFEYDAR
ncbi:DUF3011 domain-containing protein [Luteitalea sp.]|uniref:DUF3011 domain-containing protein n=1 Tax=Luteitalea sp. TaxID=2004800 RepID=UPI0025BF5243|nr:DUF3011 domain-containing protein [Luteitalea sp.]